jgi:hypothetical protein
LAYCSIRYRLGAPLSGADVGLARNPETNPAAEEECRMAELGAVELAQFTKDLDDTKKMIFQTQYASERKDRGTAVILAIFLYDRIWLGDTAMGIIKIITLGACGIWTLIDLFTAGSRCDDYNRRKAQEIAQALKLQA